MILACLAYLASAVYGAITQGVPELWRYILRPALEQRAAPWRLGTYVCLWMVGVLVGVLWAAAALSVLYVHPFVADAMNWAGAMALGYYFTD